MKFIIVFFSIFLFDFGLCVLANDVTSKALDFKELKVDKKSRSTVKFELFLDSKPLGDEECKLLLTSKDSSDEIKIYETVIRSGDQIELPEGFWKISLQYKHSVSNYESELRLHRKKKYEIKVDFKTWFLLQKGEYLGVLFSDKNAAHVRSLSKEHLNRKLRRLDFFTLPYKDSLFDANKTFLSDWLFNENMYGRIWYLSYSPIPISWQSKPSFTYEALNEVNNNNTLSFYYHPTDRTMEDPILIKNFKGDFYKNFFEGKTLYYPYLASSLIIDTLSGPLYSGLDINIYNEYDLRLWYFLLNMGYKIPIVSSLSIDAKLEKVSPFLCLHSVEKDDLVSKLTAIKEGKSIVTTGPNLKFHVDNFASGSVLKANGDVYKLGLSVDLNPSEWDYIKSIQIIRNGKVVKSLLMTNRQNILDLNFYNLYEKEYAWYLAIVETTDGKKAISNPIYFTPSDFKEPTIFQSAIQLKFQDESGEAINDVAIKIKKGRQIVREMNVARSSVDLLLALNLSVEIEKVGFFSQEIPVSEMVDLQLELAKLMTVEDGGVTKLTDMEFIDKLKKKLQVGIKTITLKMK